jgi:hypothetical protein
MLTANNSATHSQLTTDNSQFKFLLFNIHHISLTSRPAGLTRPAPAEPPQGRKAARVGGRSGAM